MSTGNAKRKRAAAAVLFSLIMACVLGLVGFLGASYLWGRYGAATNDPDDTDAYLCGLLVGGVVAISAGMVSLLKFWPKSSQINGEIV